jgi:hypothetical protein
MGGILQSPFNEWKAMPVSNEDLLKIRTMWLSGDQEDMQLAMQWLTQLIGELDTAANLFALSFYNDWEDDSDYIVDEGTFWRMRFRTFPVYFGKDYRYEVTFHSKLLTEEIVNTSKEYSRWQVGNCEPKWDFCQMVCDVLRKKGIQFHNQLFVRQKIETT